MELSKDQAIAAINKLIEEGKITEEQVTQAVADNPPPEVCTTIDSLHTFLCIHSHDPKEEDICMYYKEEDTDTCWQKPFHKDWSNKAAGIILRHNLDGFNDLKEALRLFAESIRVVGISKYRTVVLEMMNWVREKEAFSPKQIIGEMKPLDYTGGGLVHHD